MTRVNQLELAVFADDEVAAELVEVIAMRIAGFLSAKPSHQIKPACFQIAGTPVGAFQSVGIVDFTVAVEENGEMIAIIAHPLLDGGKCSEGDNDNARIPFFEFILVLAQLCHMLTAGNSTQVTQENKQDIVVRFEKVLKRDFFSFC